MAKGRTYARDARGRFASGGSGSSGGSGKGGRAKVTGGTLGARASLSRSRRKLTTNASPQQKAAVTRGAKALTAARRGATKAIPATGPRGTISKGGKARGGARSAGARNGIRPSSTRGSASRPAANSIRPVELGSTGRGLRGDRGRSKQAIEAYTRRLMRAQRNYSTAQGQKGAKGKAGRRAERSERVARAAVAEYNRPRVAIKPFRPVTANGQLRRLERQIDREMKGAADAVRNLGDAVRKARPQLDQISREIQRLNAEAIAKRLSTSRIDRMVAGVELGTIGGRSGAKAIQRRMERAAAAAARGSRAGARARVIYGNQLAAMGPGKPSGGRNNLRPGPRNKQDPPKKRGRKRKPKPS